MPKLTIGVSGLARSGKDTFTQLLIEELAKLELKAKRFALADDLKNELREFMIRNYQIDIWNCTPDDKELVRDLLVFHGKMKRLRSSGAHWTTKLKEKIELSCEIDVAIVSDVRYDVYPVDECTWVTQVMNGPLVHIKRYVRREVVDIKCGLTAPKVSVEDWERGYERIYLPPPNQDEASNDPRLIAKASYHVDWATGDIETNCRPEVVKFVAWLKEKAYLSV